MEQMAVLPCQGLSPARWTTSDLGPWAGQVELVGRVSKPLYAVSGVMTPLSNHCVAILFLLQSITLT